MLIDRWVVAALMAAIIYPASCASAQAADSSGIEKESRTFVQSFYKWYLTNPRSDRACKDKAASFSAELLKRLNEDYAASQKSKDEVVGLDFDPFLNTNAEPHAKYVASKVTKKNNNFLVQVDGSGGNRTDHTRIIPEVAWKAGKAQFVNFHYDGFKAPDDNLLSILKTLRNNRIKDGIK
jgi:hypothetical protein